MKELLPQISNWSLSSSAPFAIATVIKTWGSSPRPVGSSLIISETGEMVGSVSGGCVEGAVVRAAQDLIRSNDTQLLEFGISNEDAWNVGLTCGGKVTIFVEQFISCDVRPGERKTWKLLSESLKNNQPCVFITQLSDGESGHTLIMPDGSLEGQPVSDNLKQHALDAYTRRKHLVVEELDSKYFLQVFPRKSQILIIGAAHITADLVEFANSFDFETVVIDPRGAFAQKTHFHSQPDLIIEQYPSEAIPNYTLDAYTYAVILSHDPKIDDDALQLLLKSDIAYIGALGSKKTHTKRVARLTERGFSANEIGRIYAPIGINIHASKPREIALSIISQIIEVQNGAS